jgi:hypothetical protein
MASDRHFNSNNKDMSRASMKIEAWQGKIMGLKSGATSRENTKKGNNMEAPGDGRASTVFSNEGVNADDVNKEQANQTSDTRA